MKTVLVYPSKVPVARRGELERDARLAQFFDAHYAPLCRLAYVILGDAQLAEEMVMEALLKTFTGFRRIRDLDRADIYLRRAVVNLCRSRIRRKAIEMRVNAAVLRSEERRAPDWDQARHGDLAPRRRSLQVRARENQGLFVRSEV